MVAIYKKSGRGLIAIGHAHLKLYSAVLYLSPDPPAKFQNDLSNDCRGDPDTTVLQRKRKKERRRIPGKTEDSQL